MIKAAVIGLGEHGVRSHIDYFDRCGFEFTAAADPKASTDQCPCFKSAEEIPDFISLQSRKPSGFIPWMN